MDRIQNQKVTAGFKVTKAEKAAIEAAAKRSGMNVSQYLNALVFEKHDKINRCLHLPEDLIITPEYQADLQAKIQFIQQRYPNKTASKILLAASTVAIENERLHTNNKLKKYL